MPKEKYCSFYVFPRHPHLGTFLSFPSTLLTCHSFFLLPRHQHADLTFFVFEQPTVDLNASMHLQAALAEWIVQPIAVYAIVDKPS